MNELQQPEHKDNLLGDLRLAVAIVTGALTLESEQPVVDRIDTLLTDLLTQEEIEAATVAVQGFAPNMSRFMILTAVRQALLDGNKEVAIGLSLVSESLNNEEKETLSGIVEHIKTADDDHLNELANHYGTVCQKLSVEVTAEAGVESDWRVPNKT